MKYLLMGILLVLISLSSFSEELICQKHDVTKGTFFIDMYEGVDDISLKICNKLLDGSEVDQAMNAWFINWKEKLSLHVKPLEKIGVDSYFIINNAYKSLTTLSYPKNINASKSTKTGKYHLKYNNDEIAVLDNADCKGAGPKNCKILFDNLHKVIVAPFESSYQYANSKAGINIALKNTAWSNYFENSRSQTFIDLAINTWYYQDKLKENRLVPPPNKQYFALHPSIIMHYSVDAEHGEQMKEALAIEWAGINYWQLKIPLGLSVVSTYADRVSVKSVTHGVMFHINNTYSFGLTTNSEQQHGIFVTLDLLKLFEDKKSNYKNYLNNIKDL
jgi:hypothetical protein